MKVSAAGWNSKTDNAYITNHMEHDALIQWRVNAMRADGVISTTTWRVQATFLRPRRASVTDQLAGATIEHSPTFVLDDKYGAPERVGTNVRPHVPGPANGPARMVRGELKLPDASPYYLDQSDVVRKKRKHAPVEDDSGRDTASSDAESESGSDDSDVAEIPNRKAAAAKAKAKARAKAKAARASANGKARTRSSGTEGTWREATANVTSWRCVSRTRRQWRRRR